VGWLFRVNYIFRGLRLAAIATNWWAGDGPEVRGPPYALLLVPKRTEVAPIQLTRRSWPLRQPQRGVVRRYRPE
jgi:hypothetical protein